MNKGVGKLEPAWRVWWQTDNFVKVELKNRTEKSLGTWKKEQ